MRDRRDRTGVILPGSVEIAAFKPQKHAIATNKWPIRLAGLTPTRWALTLRMPGNEAIHFAQVQHSAAITDHVVTVASPGMLKSICFIASAYTSYVATVIDYMNAARCPSFDKMPVFLI